MSALYFFELVCMGCGRAEFARLRPDFDEFTKWFARDTRYFLSVMTKQHEGVVLLYPYCEPCTKAHFSEDTVKTTRQNTTLTQLKKWGASAEAPDPLVKLGIACGECGRIDYMTWRPTFQEIAAELKRDIQYEISLVSPPGAGRLNVMPLCAPCATKIHGAPEERVGHMVSSEDYAGKVNYGKD